MKLQQLIKTDDQRKVTALNLDSRKKLPGSIFFCVEGQNNDGHDFADQAIENGASVVVHRKDLVKKEGVFYHKVDDVKNAMKEISNHFYENPSKDLFVYGVTGTNGKTTIMKTLQNILIKLGVKAGYIGTISIEYLDKKFQPNFTTPDIIELNHNLKDMVDLGVEEVCLEVSSQGLDLRRVEGIDFDMAVFTNLSHEHLDYHKTMEKYFEAKEILFKQLKEGAPRIINIDDPYGLRLVNKYPEETITYGTRDDADYKAKDIRLSSNRSEFVLVHKGLHYDVLSKLVAHFNVLNILAVIAILHQRGFAIESILAQLKDVEQVEGRLSKVDGGQDFDVYVDFAHTPDSMEKVYEFVRSTLEKDGEIITVFGSAGQRDALKRPLVGQIGSQLCDWVILTEDDRHGDNLDAINKDIIKGITKNNFEVIPNREQAIIKAISKAKSKDAVVILGKGEERVITRGQKKEAWAGDDTIALKAIKEKIK